MMRLCTPHTKGLRQLEQLNFQCITYGQLVAKQSNHIYLPNSYNLDHSITENEQLLQISDSSEDLQEGPTIVFLKPSKIVPLPQILSDSKKTSAPRRCWKHFNILNGFLIMQLFTLVNVATCSNSGIEPCRSPKFFSELNVNSTDQCTTWSDKIIPEICSAGTQSRLRILKQVFLFPELKPLPLYEVFSVGQIRKDNWSLRKGQEGNDCISGSINRCTHCFKKISGTLLKLNEAFNSFDTTLSRFDCLPAIDTASATRPFSPNATCTNCKIWYRRWLLVHSLQIWERVPCINWCYYTQLACPHLAPAKLWDYAGHPSFQCRDMDIDSWRHECDCIHPCDVRGIVAPGISGNAPSVQHDFFPAQIHCETRKRECYLRLKLVKKFKRSGDPLKVAFSSNVNSISRSVLNFILCLFFSAVFVEF